MLKRSIAKNSILLGIFALITAGILAGTFLLTREKIQTAERAAAQRALYEIIPQHQHDNDLLHDTLLIPASLGQALGLKEDSDAYLARREGQVTAIILSAIAPDGYSGDIHMSIGVNRDGTLAGVRVVSHRETPGLGDKLETGKSDWILSFDGKSLTQPEPSRWHVKKDGGDFDQFTGATITPRAVVHRVYRTLAFVQEHHARLFQLDDKTEGDEGHYE